jgi:hypothetical protein
MEKATKENNAYPWSDLLLSICKNASQYNFTYKNDISVGEYNRYVEIRELKLILVNTTIISADL